MQSVPVPSGGSPQVPSSRSVKPLPGSGIFEQALSDFQKGLSNKELVQFQCIEFKDVEDIVKSIERDQKKKKKMQNIARIKPFLHAMRQYGKIVEVFLNTSNIIAFIWVSSRSVLHSIYYDVCMLLTRYNTGPY